MEKNKKLVAISKDEKNVFIVKNVSDDKYNRLLNKQEKEKCIKELLEESNNKWKENVDLRLRHCSTLELVLAKSVYDNFVDRGLIENDDNFQKMWFDFYFNDGELSLKDAPLEYRKIAEKVGNLQ